MQQSDIESNVQLEDNEKSCKYPCCILIGLIGFILVIMAITGELANKN